jgi:DNA-binding transcriptional LysR family regulator
MADRRLQVFHAVAKQLSFTKAADALFMTQPAVTFQIKQLEEHFNSRLFERGHGKISLTPAGEVVVQYAERILGLSAELDTRIKELTGRFSGPLLVGASLTIAEFLLPRVLGEFKAKFPEVQARLTVANSETIEIRVAEHALDIGLIEGPLRPGNQGGLVAEICCEDELQVVVAADHSLAAMAEIAPAVLAAHGYISREPGSGTREFADLHFREAGIDPATLNIVMELGSPEAIKGVVETGIGYAIMSRMAVDKERRIGSLCAIPLRPRLRRVMSIVYPRERFRSRLANSFIEFAKLRLATMTRPATAATVDE